MKNKKAFITLLSSKDYWMSTVILNESLKKTNSKYNLIVAVTEDILDKEIIEIFDKHHILYVVIPVFKYSDSTIESAKQRGFDTVLNTASKICIFDLNYFDKLVYLDSDSIILDNIDDLMDFPDGSMLYDGDPFSGLFVFNPKNHCTEMYKTILSHSMHFDGDMFSNLWFHVKDNLGYRIDISYFYPINRQNNNNTKIKAVHFINKPKPWLVDMEEYIKHIYENIDIIKYYYELKDKVNGK